MKHREIPGGTELPAAALQFPLRGPAVVSVVAGMRTEAQIESKLSWFTSEIDACLWEELPRPAH